MPMQVCMGATMMCTMGMAPSSLVVLPVNRVLTDEVPDANIMDHIPLVNIMPFGMCISPANPMVAAATAAAMGVHEGRQLGIGRRYQSERDACRGQRGLLAS